MYASRAKELIVRHHKYGWVLTFAAFLILGGSYLKRDFTYAATHTFTQSTWSGGYTTSTSTHTLNTTGWTEFATSTGILATTTLGIASSTLNFIDDTSTSTTSTLTVTGGTFDAGTQSSTATTTSAVRLSATGFTAPTAASGHSANTGITLKEDGTVWTYGGGGATYATWNPADINADYSLSNGNLTITRGYGGAWRSGRATLGKSSGKWYWEISGDSSQYHLPGIGKITDSVDTYVGDTGTSGISYYGQTGNLAYGGALYSYGTAYNTAVIGVAFDADNLTIQFFLNGASQGTFSMASAGLTAGTYYPMWSDFSAGAIATANFGATSFVYSAPDNFNAGLYSPSPTYPVQVGGLSGITAVAAGTDSFYALKSDGTVWAWGDNTYGELGDGTTTNSATPVQVSGLTNVVSISAGAYSGYAVKSDGTVWAWGTNTNSELGDGTTTQRTTPVQVSTITGIIAVAGGSSSAYALKSDGTVWSWGLNTNNELGDGTTTLRATPVQVSGLTEIFNIAAGASSGYALKSDGTVYAWGGNTYGQIGNNTTTNQSTPIQVSGLSNVSEISAGLYSGYALKPDGTAWSWGANNVGQLGDTTTTERHTPVQISSLSGIISIAGGNTSGYAIKSDGVVYAWGGNDAGQLGDNTLTNSSTPVVVGSSFSAGTYVYAASGTFTSAVIDLGLPAALTTLDYTKKLYSQTLTIDVRAGNTATPDGSWTAWQTSVASGSSIAGLTGNRYVQYSANFSTLNTAYSAVLKSVTINYDQYPTTGNLTSSVYDTEEATNPVTVISWTATGTSTTEILKFQIRSSADGITWSDWCGASDTGATCAGTNYFVDANNGVEIAGTNPLRSDDDDRYFQYKAFFAGSGAATPILTQVVVGYGAPPATTLADATDPGNATIAPGASATVAGAFTFITNGGTDTVTEAVVGLGAGTYTGVSLVEITDVTGATVYGSTANPASDTPSVTLTALTASTTITEYKIRITPKSATNMPAVPGAAYAVSAKINSWTGTNTTLGTDTAGATITIDNESPADATSVSASAGAAQVVVGWTNPVDSDFHSVVVLRRATSAIGDVPVEGTTYIVGDTIGTATVACVVASPTATCTDSGLSNGTAYHYKVFARDTSVNYSAGVVPTGSPATPAAAVSPTPASTPVSTGGSAGTVTPEGKLRQKSPVVVPPISTPAAQPSPVVSEVPATFVETPEGRSPVVPPSSELGIVTPETSLNGNVGSQVQPVVPLVQEATPSVTETVSDSVAPQTTPWWRPVTLEEVVNVSKDIYVRVVSTIISLFEGVFALF